MQIVNNYNNFDNIKKIKCKVIHADGTMECNESKVVCEHFMDLIVNDCLVAKLVCSPDNLEEMIIGRLITESMIESITEIDKIEINDTGDCAIVILNKNIIMADTIENELTSSTGNKMLRKNVAAEQLKVLQDAEWEVQWIFDLANEFANGSKLHKMTKGTHCCYLSVQGEVTYASEDIGRHNAMDKVIGYMALNNIKPEDCIVFTTGRVPTDMIKKTIAAKIPVLVSKAVPTDAAIKMAKEYNLNLICKAWPDSICVID